jgi:hypothetical protein
MLYLIEVQIIEALRDSDEPLSPGELFEACGEEPPWFVFVHRMRQGPSHSAVRCRRTGAVQSAAPFGFVLP